MGILRPSDKLRAQDDGRDLLYRHFSILTINFVVVILVGEQWSFFRKMIDINILANKAIRAALKGEWREASMLNLQILEKDAENLEAMLRLAKAYTNLNKISKAKKIYRQVLSLDKYNPVAKRNLARLKKIKNWILPGQSRPPTPLFLEEPGKTKSVFLVRLTCEKNLATLEIGEPVNLIVNPKSISVSRKNGQYLGRLPDDLAFRLIHLIQGGNHYQAFVRLVEKDKLQIFIKEVKKGARHQQISSFPPKSKDQRYHTFLPAQMLGQPPLVMGDKEQD